MVHEDESSTRMRTSVPEQQCRQAGTGGTLHSLELEPLLWPVLSDGRIRHVVGGWFLLLLQGPAGLLKGCGEPVFGVQDWHIVRA